MGRSTSKEVKIPGTETRLHGSLLAAVCADGSYMQPLFITKGRDFPIAVDEAGVEQPANPTFMHTMQPTGNNEGGIFMNWCHRFVKWRKDSGAKGTILVMDGALSHFNDEALKVLHDAGMYVIRLPSNATSKLCVLDLTVFPMLKSTFGKLKSKFNQALCKSQKGKISKLELIDLVADAWESLEHKLPSQIRKGFKEARIFPAAAKIAVDEEIAAEQKQSDLDAELAKLRAASSSSSLSLAESSSPSSSLPPPASASSSSSSSASLAGPSSTSPAMLSTFDQVMADG